jgi:hypothetical protein
VIKIIAMVLLGIVTSGLRPLAVRDTDTYFEMAQKLIDEQGARLADELPLNVLVVGDDNAEFLPKIKAYLVGRGYKLNIQSINYWRNERTSSFLITLASMIDHFQNHYDIVFMNAPPLESYLQYIDEASRFMKKEGSIVIRFKETDDMEPIEPRLYSNYVHQPFGASDYMILRVVTSLPRGRIELSQTAYLMKHKDSLPVRGYGVFEIIGGARLAQIVEESA